MNLLSIQATGTTPLPLGPLSRHCRATVIIPARDEAAGIGATLAALAGQQDCSGAPFPSGSYELIVLANNCGDDTAARVRLFAEQHPALTIHLLEQFFPPEQANVGTARRLLFDAACQRFLQAGRPQGIILSTDADTVPQENWLAANLTAFAAGADAVGGRILVAADERAALSPGVQRAYLQDVGYRSLVAEVESLLDPLAADPWPRHYQHFSASLALTAQAYAAVGGLPIVSALEDLGLVLALTLADARIRHEPAVRVVTSARTTTRAVVGLSRQFQEWSVVSTTGDAMLVESVDSLVWRVCQRRLLRRYWQHATALGPLELRQLQTGYGLPLSWLAQQRAQAATFGLFELAVARWQGRAVPFAAVGPLQPIDAAIRTLRLLRACLYDQPRLGAPDKEVKSIRLRALPHEVVEDVTLTVSKFLVDIVAHQRRIIDRQQPVDQ